MPKYFIKLYHQNMQLFSQYFLNDEQLETLSCPESYHIYSNSIVYQYLLKDYPVKFYSN